MPMPSQASGAAAHFFAIGKAMRRQVSSPAPPRLAEPQRNVNSHIHATNGPHTRPPTHPQTLGSHRRTAPESQPRGEDEPTAACPDRRAHGSGPAADRPSVFFSFPLCAVLHHLCLSLSGDQLLLQERRITRSLGLQQLRLHRRLPLQRLTLRGTRSRLQGTHPGPTRLQRQRIRWLPSVRGFPHRHLL